MGICRVARLVTEQQLKEFKLLLIIWLLTFCVILPVVFKSNVHSPYHKIFPSQENASIILKHYKADNFLGHSSASQYLSKLPLTAYGQQKILSQWDKESKFKLLVTIITMPRKNHGSSVGEQYDPKYLTQIVARYALLKLDKRAHQLTDIRILICNIEPGIHEEAQLMSRFSDIVHTQEGRRDRMSHLDTFEKEKQDYVDCLNRSFSASPDYILLAEDDALPHLNLLDKLDQLFTYRLPRLNNTFGFIKLFHPTRLNGYITGDVNRLLEWVALASLLEHLVFAFLYISRARIMNSSIMRFIIFLYFLLLLLMIGRINVNEWRKLSAHLYRLVPSPSCCTPALLYNVYGARTMVTYLSNVTCRKGFAKDSAMDLFTRSSGLQKWYLEPKLYTHIGVFTTLRKTVVNPEIVD